jgi:oligopeptidase B
MKLMHCKVGNTAVDQWQELLPHSEDRQICDLEVFKNFVAVEGREGGLTQLWVMKMNEAGLPSPDTMHRIGFKDDLFEVATSVNKVWDTARLRLTYSSLASPLTWYELDMATAADPAPALTTIKQKEVLNFDGDLYRTQQIFATGL